MNDLRRLFCPSLHPPSRGAYSPGGVQQGGGGPMSIRRPSAATVLVALVLFVMLAGTAVASSSRPIRGKVRRGEDGASGL